MASADEKIRRRLFVRSGETTGDILKYQLRDRRAFKVQDLTIVMTLEKLAKPVALRVVSGPAV